MSGGETPLFFSLSKERRFEEPIIRRNLQPAFNESFDLKLEEERWEDNPINILGGGKGV